MGFAMPEKKGNMKKKTWGWGQLRNLVADERGLLPSLGSP
jgi:hypothetical protein